MFSYGFRLLIFIGIIQQMIYKQIQMRVCRKKKTQNTKLFILPLLEFKNLRVYHYFFFSFYSRIDKYN